MKNELPLIFPTTPVARPKKKSRTRNDTSALPGSGRPRSPRPVSGDADQHDQREEDQLEDEPDDLEREPESHDQCQDRDREVQPGVIHKLYVSEAEAPARGSSSGRDR